MSKLSIGKHGINVDIQEKSNVMSPFNHLLYVVIPCLVFMSLNKECRSFSLICFSLLFLFWIAIYTFHSFTNPKLLQMLKIRER